MKSISEVNNPYLQSRALWNDLYGDIQTKLDNAYRLLAVVSAVLIVSVLSVVWMAMQHQVKPYLTVLHGSQALTLHEEASSEFQALKPKLAQIYSKQFIEAVRSRSVDDTMNRQHQIEAYSHASGEAVSWLKQQWQQTSSEFLRHIHVNTVLIKTDRTMSLRWTEETRDPKSGETLQRDQYTADMQYTFQAPSSDSELAARNPLGFYVTHIVVGKEQALPEENER